MEKINSLRAEAVRLIGVQKDLLQQIKDKVPAQASDSKNPGDPLVQSLEGHFTPDAIERKINALDENLIKVQNLDMVLAVVGTMKAGKSTCINAIVGREILPNRNRPMTALPTLIRHVPGAIEPVLHFDEQQQKPIKSLIKELQQKLSKVDLESKPKIASDSDLLALAQKLQAKFELQTRYEGEEGIFTFLKSLNDLVRLSKELDIAFPFESYTSVADFPVIEVEFFHLKQEGQSETLGRFALLDTPGFNEAGQSEFLLPMLKEQLDKATAVLAVLDYTQLKSESEAKLREELESIAYHSGDRMFALVNKFDASNANSDDAQATKKYVANNLLNKVFGKNLALQERIFPVSGQKAYLAKRAELEITNHGRVRWVPDSPKTWVDDFGQLGLGTRYAKYITDHEEVLEACKDLWEGSLFAAPLTHAIQYSHKNAAQMAIQAATAKLNETAFGSQNAGMPDGIGPMLSMRQQGFDASMGELEHLIGELNSSLKGLKNKEKNAAQKLAKLIRESQDSVNQQMDAKARKIQNEVKASLQGGGNFKEVSNDVKSASFGAVFRGAFNSGEKKRSKSSTTKALQIELGDVMTFTSKKEASAKLNEVADLVKDYLDNAAQTVQDGLEDAGKMFEQQLESLREEVEKEAVNFGKHAERAGFKGLKVHVPRLKFSAVKADTKNKNDELIEDKSHKVTRSREQSGGWGWFKRKVDLFDNGWGTDDYQDEVSKFEFSKKDLIKSYDSLVTDYTTELKNSVQSDFNKPLEASEAAFFAQMDQAFNGIRESMEASRNDQLQSKEEQVQIKSALQELLQLFDDSVDDIRQLKRNAEKLALA